MPSVQSRGYYTQMSTQHPPTLGPIGNIPPVYLDATGPIGFVPPAEHEANYYQQVEVA